MSSFTKELKWNLLIRIFWPENILNTNLLIQILCAKLVSNLTNYWSQLVKFIFSLYKICFFYFQTKGVIDKIILLCYFCAKLKVKLGHWFYKILLVVPRSGLVLSIRFIFYTCVLFIECFRYIKQRPYAFVLNRTFTFLLKCL